MKPEGLGAAKAALRYWELRQQVVAHNLANVSTHGFKGERAFALLLGGAPALDAATDFRAGRMTPTGGPLDLAIEGPGFFVVSTPAGLRWTRGGAFALDAEGQLVDGSGNPVIGEDGPLVLPPGPVEISADGGVRVAGKEAGRLRVDVAPEGAEPVREGDTLFVPVEGGGAAPGAVRQGLLEESNVDPLSAMVDMIAVQRSYAAVQASLKTMGEVNGIVANELGKIS